jgi:uncharacterized membrane-anchored protein YhcB (DUF1043 family)
MGEAKLCLPRNEEGGVRMGVLAAEAALTIIAGATDGLGTGLLTAGIFAIANRLHNGGKDQQKKASDELAEVRRQLQEELDKLEDHK